jgi:hypothetical protein
MAIYKTTSSKTILRKVFRDLNLNNDNWIDDAIEWIGEALEHIGSSAQLEKKVCMIDILDFKGSLPADLYYVNQVAINASEGAVGQEALISQLRNQVKLLNDNLKTYNNNLNDEIEQSTDGTYTSNITTDDLITYESLRKTTDHEIREINVRLAVIEDKYLNTTGLSPLAYCTTNFPEALHCDNCVNKSAKCKECYYIENGRIKTSFVAGKVCLSYMAFPTDDDCFPLVPDDISFKEAMFWYVYKKILLGGEAPTANGINYIFAEQQWKYYCTQARNAAVFPDIDKMESFMNQWVRLIPNINRASDAFENLGTRESLDRSL